MVTNRSEKLCGEIPVVCLSWFDCQEFINKVNGSGAVIGSGTFSARLPTEAEWEYACRAGTTGAYGGNGCLYDMGWSDGDWWRGGRPGRGDGSLKPVGKLMANSWGFYDMHGNASEWCQDWYDDYRGGDEIDPQGPAYMPTSLFGAWYRVQRGGGAGNIPRNCRSAYRCKCYDRSQTGGFRLCCSVKQANE